LVSFYFLAKGLLQTTISGSINLVSLQFYSGYISGNPVK